MAVLFDEQGNYTGPQEPSAPELDVSKAPPGKGAEVLAARNAAVEQKMGVTPEVQKMGGAERFGRALWGNISEPFRGAAEKFELAFPGKGTDAAAPIGDERSARREALRAIEATPAGMAGMVLGKGAPLALASTPAGAAGIAGLTGFLGGGPDRPEGLFNELGTSALHGGVEAGTTWLPAKGLEMMGRTAGALTGQLTKAGARAKEMEEAAARLGLPRPSFGQTYPGGAMEHFEKASPSYNKLVEEQAEALHKAITSDTPYGVPAVGAKYLDELKAAINNRYNAGRDMYRKVDEIVDTNNLGKFMPGYTANVVTNTRNPGYQMAVEELGKYGFDAASMGGMKAAQLAKLPLRFENFNSMRVATNKAWGNINRQLDTARAMGNAPSAEMKAARDYLNDLRTALDSDAERWAAQNAGNREAVDAFKGATKYWKEQVVPTVVENPFARKVSSNRRGFSSPEQATRLSLGTANSPLVDRLLPTMSRQGADMTSLLRTLPEARAKVLTGEELSTPRGALHAAAQAAEGHRDAGIIEKLLANLPVVSPAFRGTMNLTPVRRLAGAEDVTAGWPRRVLYPTAVPRVAGGLQEYGEDRLRDRGGR